MPGIVANCLECLQGVGRERHHPVGFLRRVDMNEIRRLARVVLTLVLPIAGIACGQPEEGTAKGGIGAEVPDLAEPAGAGTPITVTGRVTEFALPPPPNGGPSIYPGMITVGRDQDLWFRTSLSELGHMSRNGRRVAFVPIPSIGIGLANGIALGADGHIWFGTAAGIARLNHNGTSDEFPLSDLTSAPQDVVAGRDGNLWVLGYDFVHRVTTAGVITSFPLPTSTLNSGNHMTNGPDGNVWFTDGRDRLLLRVTPAGVITAFPAGPGGQLFGIAGGHDGHIWFTRQGGGAGDNAIARMTIDGVVSTVVQLPDSTTTQPNPPSGMPMVITAGDDRAMYYTTYFEQPLNYIGRVTPAGHLTKFIIPSPGAASFGITSDREGDIWFTENFNNIIGRLRTRR